MPLLLLDFLQFHNERDGVVWVVPLYAVHTGQTVKEVASQVVAVHWICGSIKEAELII